MNKRSLSKPVKGYYHNNNNIYVINNDRLCENSLRLQAQPVCRVLSLTFTHSAQWAPIQLAQTMAHNEISPVWPKNDQHQHLPS